MNRRSLWLIVSLVTLLGAVLRLWSLSAAPLWSDEALTALIASHAPFDLLRFPLDPTPPLFYWVQAALVPAGAPTWWTRLPALLAGIATIPLLAALAGTLGGRKAAIAAVLFAALSPLLIDHAHEARSYALLVMLLSAAAWMAVRALGPDARRRDTILFVAFGLMALLTHVVAAFVVFPMAAVLGWQGVRRGAAPGWRPALAALVLLYAPEALRTVRAARRSSNFSWLEQASPADALALVGKVATGLEGWIGLLALALLAALAWARREEVRALFAQHRGAGLVLLAAAAEPVLLYAVGLVGKPLLMPRAALPMLVGVIPLAALVLTRPGRLQGPALAVAALVALGGLWTEGLERPKEDWRGAADVVIARRPAVVLVCPQWQAPALLAALAERGPWRPALLVDTARGPTLVPAEGDWVQTFYDALYWDDTSNLRRAKPKAARTVDVPAGEGLMLMGSCQYPDRVAGWVKPVARTPLWRSTRAAPVANMTIEQWRWATPIPARQVER